MLRTQFALIPSERRTPPLVAAESCLATSAVAAESHSSSCRPRNAMAHGINNLDPISMRITPTAARAGLHR